MLYPDASLVLAAVLRERHSEAALAALAVQEELAASEWLLTEVASALGIKRRAGALSASDRDRAFAACTDIIAASATMLPVTGGYCRRAAEMIEKSNFRAGVALHLAIAAAHGATVLTLDRKMAEAGQALGLGTRLLG